MSSKLSTYLKGQHSTLDKKHSALLEQNHGAVWIHAASVGEFEQARPIIERLKANGERRKVVVTFFSPSGYEARKGYELADGVFYLPFATRRNAKRFIEALQPSMAIFVKYEFWPAYLRELKKEADQSGRTIAQQALRWVLSQPGVTSVLVGASSTAQLETNLAVI